jgi:hypothetical protein
MLPLAGARPNPHAAGMFDAYCDQHGCRVLLPASHLLDCGIDGGGRVCRMRCWCGAVAIWRSTRAPQGAA